MRKSAVHGDFCCILKSTDIKYQPTLFMGKIKNRDSLRTGGIEPPAKPWKGFMLPLC